MDYWRKNLNGFSFVCLTNDKENASKNLKGKKWKLFAAYKRLMLHSLIFCQRPHFGKKGEKKVSCSHTSSAAYFMLLPAELEEAQPGFWRHSVSWLSSLCFSVAPSGAPLHCSLTRINLPWIWLTSSKWLLLFQTSFLETKLICCIKWRAVILPPQCPEKQY